ncbi:hypothetical protein DLAC_03856 [Tieghemostelium lacteum]|uniref:Uncharacterized protein n=1 Tax=Tieghemostelium lacteum TaxID=361077 RepID=A0A152A0V9_TIELA|nr:hypothetical protein DLAC_03856 [Tieghemostelium lacteum]|eukprot:KYQ99892.1 hypothetical protein DLAC_03856 [Tieghemostelium lacteum]
MTSHTLTSIIPMNANDFFKIAESESFDQFQVPYFNLKSHRLIEQTENDTHIIRKIEIKPKSGAPKILTKFLGNEDLRYIDTQVIIKSKRELHFKTNAPLLTDHIHVDGIVKIEELDADTCLRVMKVNFKFTGPLYFFSKVIESHILSELKQTIEIYPKVVADYKVHIGYRPKSNLKNSVSDTPSLKKSGVLLMI